MKELGSGTTIRLAQDMIKSKHNFEAALGAAIMNGEYRDQRKIITTWPDIINKYLQGR